MTEKENVLKTMMKSDDDIDNYDAKYFLSCGLPIPIKDILIQANNRDSFRQSHITYLEHECDQYDNEFERVVYQDILMKEDYNLVSKDDFVQLLIENITNYCISNKSEKNLEVLKIFSENSDYKELRKLDEYIKSKLMPKTMRVFIYS